MATVTVSPKFQVVIPDEIRSKLKLHPGQKVVVLEKDGVVHLIPLKPIRETRGMTRGTGIANLSDKKDRV